MAAPRPSYLERPDIETLAVRGDDRLEWLQGVLTCDVSKLEAGSGRWGLSLTKPGKILTDVYVVPAAGVVYLGVAAGTARAVAEWFDGFIVMEDVEIQEESGNSSWFTLYGEGARALAERVARDNAGWLSAAMAWTDSGGAVLVGPKTQLDRVRSMLAEGGDELDAQAWLRFRIEALLPLYGVDYDGSRNPHEASLDRRAVSWTKGCYLGQEAVCMQDMRGKVKRRLVTITIDTPEPPRPGAAVESATGEPVGTVTSSSPGREGKAVAIASIRTQYADLATSLVVEGKAARVTVAPAADGP